MVVLAARKKMILTTTALSSRLCVLGSIWRAALNVARVCKHQEKPAGLSLQFGRRIQRNESKWIAVYATAVRKGYSQLTQGEVDR